MLKLNLPDYNPKLSKQNDQLFIKCLVRKKMIMLTPEEWVRQHFINFLLVEYNMPLNSIAVEYNLTYNGLSKRADILVFRQGKPQLLVECKAASIPLNENVLKQISAYQNSLRVPQLCITNGVEHFWFPNQ